MCEKVITLIDMDCFYVQVVFVYPGVSKLEPSKRREALEYWFTIELVGSLCAAKIKSLFHVFQVETRENPSLKGKPAAVVQYNVSLKNLRLMVDVGKKKFKKIVNDRQTKGVERKL